MTLSAEPDDIDLLGRLMEMRDSAQLAGIRNDPFSLLQINNNESVLVSPGRSEGINVSTMAMRRLQSTPVAHPLGLLIAISGNGCRYVGSGQAHDADIVWAIRAQAVTSGRLRAVYSAVASARPLTDRLPGDC